MAASTASLPVTSEVDVIRAMSYLLVFSLLGCAEADHNPYELEVGVVGDSIMAQTGFVDDIVEAFPVFKVRRTASGGLTTRNWHPDGPLYHSQYSSAMNPRVFVILLGGNDANRFNEVPVEEYIDNLVALIDAMIDDGTHRIVLMTAPRNFLTPPAADAVHERLEQYAISIQWLCMPPDDEIECGPDLYSMLVESDFEDGVHPNAQGHAKISEVLLPML